MECIIEVPVERVIYIDRYAELPHTANNLVSHLEPESEPRPIQTINFEGTSIIHHVDEGLHQHLSLSEIKDGNLLKPPLFQGKPASNIFSPAIVRSENIDGSSRLLSRNIENTPHRTDRSALRLIECEVEVETVQVIREIVETPLEIEVVR